MSENQTRGQVAAGFNVQPEGASGRIVARGLNDSNMRWLAIGAFVVLSGIGFNQWASGIIRIIQAVSDFAR